MTAYISDFTAPLRHATRLIGELAAEELTRVSHSDSDPLTAAVHEHLSSSPLRC